MNGSTGGGEKKGAQVAGPDNIVLIRYDPLAISSSKLKTKLIPTEVQVERDPVTGAILKITDPSWENSNPLNDPLNDLEEEYPSNTEVDTRTDFVRDLEKQASIEVPKKHKLQSNKEQEWIEDLMKKHGNNFAKMMMDKKLNIYQLSEGDIKSRIKKYAEAKTRDSHL